MAEGGKFLDVVPFDDAAELKDALDVLMKKSSGLGDGNPSVESEGFFLRGWAALATSGEGDSYAIELLNYDPRE